MTEWINVSDKSIGNGQYVREMDKQSYRPLTNICMMW